MATKESKRINVTFPLTLLNELREYVPHRERNKIIVEATEAYLKQIRLKKVVADLRKEPAWSDESHPDLMTVDDVNRYVRKLRESSMPQSWDEIAGEMDNNG